jgi:inner membrane transporter RhtA
MFDKHKRTDGLQFRLRFRSIRMFCVPAMLPRPAVNHAGSSTKTPGSLHGVGLSLASMCSVQVGAAIAAGLFEVVPANVVVMLRQAGAALLMLLWLRPQVRRRSRPDWWRLAQFGAVFSFMNLTFYEAVERLPLGIAVTIELLGPLSVTAFHSRRRRDALLVSVAFVGVWLLADNSGEVSASGVAFALAAAGGWATYIVLSHRSGKSEEALGRLAISLGIAAFLTVPFVAVSGTGSITWRVLVIALVVAILSAVIPFTFDTLSLQRVSPAMFGLLQSLSPVLATLAGAAILRQGLSAQQTMGTVLVMVAAAASVVLNLSPGAR